MANGMKANSKGWAAIVDARRRLVAQFRLRHLTQREICEALSKSVAPGSRNPETNGPWSLFTINADCQALERQWQAEALGDTIKLKANVLAERREARRKAWQDGDLKWVLQSLKQECDLLGLNAPTKIDIEQRIRQMAVENGFDPDEAVKEAQRVINASRG